MSSPMLFRISGAVSDDRQRSRHVTSTGTSLDDTNAQHIVKQAQAGILL
jgi:hypothetical protein